MAHHKEGYPRVGEMGVDFDPEDTYYGVEQCRLMYLFLYKEHLPETEHDKSSIRDKCRDAGKKLEQICQAYDPSFQDYKVAKWY